METSTAGAVLLANRPQRLNKPAREAPRSSLQPPWGAAKSSGAVCPLLRGGFNPLDAMVESSANNRFRSPLGGLPPCPGGGPSRLVRRSKPIPVSLDTHRR